MEPKIEDSVLRKKEEQGKGFKDDVLRKEPKPTPLNTNDPASNNIPNPASQK